jgi:hypothetical protein
MVLASALLMPRLESGLSTLPERKNNMKKYIWLFLPAVLAFGCDDDSVDSKNNTEEEITAPSPEVTTPNPAEATADKTTAEVTVPEGEVIAQPEGEVVAPEGEVIAQPEGEVIAQPEGEVVAPEGEAPLPQNEATPEGEVQPEEALLEQQASQNCAGLRGYMLQACLQYLVSQGR